MSNWVRDRGGGSSTAFVVVGVIRSLASLTTLLLIRLPRLILVAWMLLKMLGLETRS